MKELKMYIDGRFIENQSDKWIDVLNPSTEEVISKMPDGTPEDARAAINAAVKAQLSWEKVLNQMPGLQIVPPQSAEVFRDDKVDLPALNGSQHSL